MLKKLEKEEIKITCPHCSKEISFAWVCKIESSLGIRYIYICTNCQKNLAVTQEKGLHNHKLQHTFA
jgi:DNA-directed RNA polymerase subunit RPC12/RpoP